LINPRTIKRSSAEQGRDSVENLDVLLVEKDNLLALIPGMKVATFCGAVHFERTPVR
jgi:hypothetical protein